MPPSESSNVGGKDKPSEASHTTSFSNGGQSLPLVLSFNVEGTRAESLVRRKGAILESISESSSTRTSAGVLAEGFFLSPNANIRANLSRASTVLPSAASSAMGVAAVPSA